MILTLHILAGFLIWKIIPSFYLALILAFLSHYILDSIPHWQYEKEKVKKEEFFSTSTIFKIILDLIAGFSLIFLLSDQITLSLLMVIVAANLPDGITLLKTILPFNLLNREEKFHKSIQLEKEGKFHQFLRIVCELSVFIFFIVFLILQ